MTDKEKKSYILSNWNISSGARITDMLKRYFIQKKENPLEIPAKSVDEAVSLAQQIIV